MRGLLVWGRGGVEEGGGEGFCGEGEEEGKERKGRLTARGRLKTKIVRVAMVAMMSFMARDVSFACFVARGVFFFFFPFGDKSWRICFSVLCSRTKD